MYLRVTLLIILFVFGFNGFVECKVTIIFADDLHEGQDSVHSTNGFNAYCMIAPCLPHDRA